MLAVNLTQIRVPLNEAVRVRFEDHVRAVVKDRTDGISDFKHLLQSSNDQNSLASEGNVNW